MRLRKPTSQYTSNGKLISASYEPGDLISLLPKRLKAENIPDKEEKLIFKDQIYPKVSALPDSLEA